MALLYTPVYLELPHTDPIGIGRAKRRLSRTPILNTDPEYDYVLLGTDLQHGDGVSTTNKHEKLVAKAVELKTAEAILSPSKTKKQKLMELEESYAVKRARMSSIVSPTSTASCSARGNPNASTPQPADSSLPMDLLRFMQEELDKSRKREEVFQHELQQQREASDAERKAGVQALELQRQAGVQALEQQRQAGVQALEQQRQAGVQALEQQRQAGVQALEQQRQAGVQALEQQRQAGLALQEDLQFIRGELKIVQTKLMFIDGEKMFVMDVLDNLSVKLSYAVQNVVAQTIDGWTTRQKQNYFNRFFPKHNIFSLTYKCVLDLALKAERLTINEYLKKLGMGGEELRGDSEQELVLRSAEHRVAEQIRAEQVRTTKPLGGQVGEQELGGLGEQLGEASEQQVGAQLPGGGEARELVGELQDRAGEWQHVGEGGELHGPGDLGVGEGGDLHGPGDLGEQLQQQLRDEQWRVEEIRREVRCTAAHLLFVMKKERNQVAHQQQIHPPTYWRKLDNFSDPAPPACIQKCRQRPPEHENSRLASTDVESSVLLRMAEDRFKAVIGDYLYEALGHNVVHGIFSLVRERLTKNVKRLLLSSLLATGNLPPDCGQLAAERCEGGWRISLAEHQVWLADTGEWWSESGETFDPFAGWPLPLHWS